MATAQEGASIDVSYPAVADLSAFQFYPVALTTSATFPDGAITTIGATATKPIGVLQDTPNAAGVMANVIISGPSKVVAYMGTINAGDALGVAATGEAVPTTTDNRFILGTAMESATDDGTNGVIEALVNVGRY